MPKKEANNPATDYKRHITGVLMNWANYAPMVEDAELRTKRVIPFKGRFFSTQNFWDAINGVPEPKRSTVIMYCIEGKSQSNISRDRDVTQALVWWEIQEALSGIEENLDKC